MNATKKIFFGMLLFTGMLMQAQVSVNVNIGSPPAWGPAGYTDVQYYYLPDIATYYDVNNSQYIYANNGKWVRATVLPEPYRTYNLYNGYKVVLNDYRGATPYVYYKEHKVKYPKGYHPKHQKTIGLPPGQAKKLAAGAHPGHGPKHKHKHDHGHGKGKGHGKKH